MEGTEKFNGAIRFVAKRLKKQLETVSDEVKQNTYEIRLRSERPLSLSGAYGTYFLSENGEISETADNALIVTADEIRDTFNRICSYSIYTFQRCINSGYIPMENGNRAGVCGTAVCENGVVTSVRDITSVNIRIARQVKGCGDEILNYLDGSDESIIIAGPPSSGKTTIIRDIVRQISSGRNGRYVKTAVIDERREISGIMNGIITNDIGLTSDVLDSYPKSEAIDIAVRTLSPETIVCDEIATQSELFAIKTGINCGVRFIVTVHAGSEEELFSRKQIEELLSTYSFKKLFLLQNGKNIGKVKKVYDTGEILHEISLRRIGCGGHFADGSD